MSSTTSMKSLPMMQTMIAFSIVVSMDSAKLFLLVQRPRVPGSPNGMNHFVVTISSC
jgi:hypothetical protein